MRADLTSAHYIYTLCFLTRGDHILMLHRRRPPNQGLWNGVGGRIEAGAPPLAACLREVQEETGYRLATARFDGLLSWSGLEFPDGGLYMYTVEAPEGEPGACAEGALAWKRREWVYTSSAVVSNLHYVVPLILAGAPPQRYHFWYSNAQITHHVVEPLPAWAQMA